MASTVPIIAKLTVAQEHYVEVSRMEFHRNLSTMERTGRQSCRSQINGRTWFPPEAFFFLLSEERLDFRPDS